MKLLINIDTGGFLADSNYSAALSDLTLKRRDLVPIDVQFLSGGTVVELASGSTGQIGLKRLGNYRGGFLASDNAWTKTGTGTDTIYTFQLDLNTIEIDAAFAEAPYAESIDAMFEVSWLLPSGARASTHTLPVYLANDIIRGDESDPGPGDPPITPASLGVPRLITKDTTGNPSTAEEGDVCINTFDNTIKLYADAAWRSIATW